MGVNAQAMTPLQLAPNTIALWQCSPLDITAPALLARYESLLSHDERERKNRFHFDKHQHTYLVTRAMEKTLLSRYTGSPMDKLVCQRNTYGKPYLCQQGITPRWYYNLSHTDDLIVMAIGQGGELGVDVESTHRKVSYQSIIRSFFAKSEIHAVEQQATEAEKNQCFYQYWTLKEAYIKAIGKGIATTLQGVAFDLSDLSHIQHSDKNTTDNRTWQHYLFDTDNAHIIALSVELREKQAPTVERHTMIPLT